MTSASDYKLKIENLDIEESLNNRSSKSVKEAQAVKKDCISYQRDLRQIKKAINLEIKEIRAGYRDKIANAGSIVDGAFSLFGKRGLGGSIRADSKRAMTQERNNVIAPYENLKLIIDNYIHSIDNAKKEIDDFIIELKSQEQLEKPSKANTKNGRFCGSCGARAAKSHKFCTQCGAKLEET